MQQIDRSVSDAVRILAHAFQDVSLKSAITEACPTHLSRNQFLILNLLNSSGPYAVGEIAKILDVSSAAVSKIVDKLSDENYVSRRPRLADRRVHEIDLLPAGQAIVERFVGIVTSRHETLMSHFSTEEKTTLISLLQRFVLLMLADDQRVDAICLQCWSEPNADCILRDLPSGCLRRLEN